MSRARGRAPGRPLAFSEMLPLVAGPRRAGSVPRAPPTCGPRLGAAVEEARLRTGWSWKGFGWGPALNVPAGCTIRGGIGRQWEERTDGWGGLLTWCCVIVSGLGSGSPISVGKRYDELCNLVAQPHRTCFGRFRVDPFTI